MPTTRSRRAAGALPKKTGFRPGRSGACEARLFVFTGQAHGQDEPPAKRVAACDLYEAMTHVRKWQRGTRCLTRRIRGDDRNGIGVATGLHAGLPRFPADGTIRGTLEKELQKICDSEINVFLSSMWDAGFDVKLGNEMNGFDERGQVVLSRRFCPGSKPSSRSTTPNRNTMLSAWAEHLTQLLWIRRHRVRP